MKYHDITWNNMKYHEITWNNMNMARVDKMRRPAPRTWMLLILLLVIVVIGVLMFNRRNAKWNLTEHDFKSAHQAPEQDALLREETLHLRPAGPQKRRGGLTCCFDQVVLAFSHCRQCRMQTELEPKKTTMKSMNNSTPYTDPRRRSTTCVSLNLATDIDWAKKRPSIARVDTGKFCASDLWNLEAQVGGAWLSAM